MSLTPGESPSKVIGRARGAMQKLALAHERHKPVKLTPQQVSALVCVLRPQVHDSYKGFLGAESCMFNHVELSKS